MEKQIKFIDPKQKCKEWIAKKWADIGDKVQLNKIKQGEFFLKNGLIYFISSKNEQIIKYYDIIMREYYTRNTEQLVYTVKLVGEKEKE